MRPLSAAHRPCQFRRPRRAVRGQAKELRGGRRRREVLLRVPADDAAAGEDRTVQRRADREQERHAPSVGPPPHQGPIRSAWRTMRIPTRAKARARILRIVTGLARMERRAPSWAPARIPAPMRATVGRSMWPRAKNVAAPTNVEIESTK